MQCKTSEANTFQFKRTLVETTSSAVAVLAASQFLPIGMQEPGRGSIGHWDTGQYSSHTKEVFQSECLSALHC